MRQVISLLFACFFAFSAQAQSDFTVLLDKEGKLVALPRIKDNYEIKIPESTYQEFTPTYKISADYKLRPFTPHILTSTTINRPMDMHVASTAYRPFFEIYTAMLQQINPMALDFHETYMKRLDEYMDIIATGFQISWPGAGGLTMMHSGLSWHNDKIRLTTSGFAGRYYTPFHPSPDLSMGVNLQMEYQANDRLQFISWGEYRHFDNAQMNPPFLFNPYSNQLNLGGAVKMKVSPNFSFGIGFNYNNSHLRNQLQPQRLTPQQVQPR